MKIVFDFDDTLFDKERFLEKLAPILEFSYEEFKAGHDLHFKDQNIFYNPWQHLKILYKENKRKYEEKVAELEDLFRDTSAYLYPEAVPLLRRAVRSREKMILLSRGDLVYQKEKIYHCDISDFFDTIIITEDKVEELKRWEEEEILFINDKKEENERIKKELPHVQIYPVGEGAGYYKLTELLDL